MSRIAIIGAGAFGTALAVVQARAGREVILWMRSRDQADALRERRENTARLPGIALPDRITPTADLSDLKQTDIVLLVLPAQQTEGFLAIHHGELTNRPIVLCAKGIDATNFRLQSEVAAAYLPNNPLAILTGPGFAAEIASNLPTALTLACADRDTGARLQSRLSTDRFRLYLSGDIIGTQLGGALKNVVAIACGLAQGAHLGESARAALMTRGFAEMSRLAAAMGADPRTLAGLSGLGDLALTCTSIQSRNFAFGAALAADQPAPGGTVEGTKTARAVCTLAATHSIEMPIAKAVADVLDRSLTIQEAMQTLLSRPLTKEH